MSVIYGFLESLPLSMFQYDFMKNAGSADCTAFCPVGYHGGKQ